MVIPFLLAVTLRVFGSAGAESALTPPNDGSLLNPNNVAAIPYSTNTGDAAAFFEAMPESRAWKIRVKARADASDRAAEYLEAGEALLQLNPSRGSTSPQAASSRSGAPATPGIRPRSSARRRTLPIRTIVSPRTAASR